MPVVVLPRWAGVLAAAAGLTVAGLAAVSATVSARRGLVPRRGVGAIGGAPVRRGPPRGPSAQRLHPGLPAALVARRDAVLHRGALRRSRVRPANRPASGTLSPGQLRAAYGLSQAAQASNKDTIAIVDAYNDWHATGDLATYRSYYGLGACKMSTRCLRVVNQKGTTAWLPKGNSGWAEEESLDLDMVSAICPKCKIILVEANNTRSAPEHRRGHRGPAGGQVHLQQLGRRRVHHRDQLRQPLQPPGRGDHRGVRRLRVRDPVAGRLARRHRGRRDHAVDEGQDPDRGEGLEPGCPGRDRFGMLRAWRPSRPGRPRTTAAARQPDRQRRRGGRRPADRACRLRLLPPVG